MQRKCKKQKNFVWTKADGYTVLFVMQNADKDTRRHFVEELSHILSEMQTGMFDRC